MWTAVLVAGVGCYLLKLAGLSVPPRVLEHPRMERIADLLPVALLSALIGVQVLASGQSLTIDARLAGLAAAVVALLLRAPFIVVVAVARPPPPSSASWPDTIRSRLPRSGHRLWPELIGGSAHGCGPCGAAGTPIPQRTPSRESTMVSKA